ncbi:thiaminase/transcriptional activator TenA [Paenibacillus hunanensis]|uniref:Aminopyrimidine aminohydrolase n=2 Tax=Paenibacillus hunanensis TaxID=539262 RepID=A0ABU1IXC9_9BACL|nr:thiaminase/transcriptional activator TenA [Paenibacillus hunanensis]
MMSFSQEIRKAADPVFEAIYHHPFVQGIAEGTLKSEQLVHYVKQDFEYLNAFMRIYGTAIAKCQHRDDMAMFNEQIGFVLHSEIHPHHNFCQVAGVPYEQLQGYLLAPSAHNYIRHMLTAAQEGDLGDILAVLLPCPWTYLEIGKRLLGEVKPDASHPFYEWIDFYGNRTDTITERFCQRLDEIAERTTPEHRERMKRHFILSCQYEYMFWDMAYTLEDWPVPIQEQTTVEVSRV